MEVNVILRGHCSERHELVKISNTVVVSLLMSYEIR